MTDEPILPLELLKPGDRAEVADVLGDTARVSRLAELGIRAGSRLEVLRTGNPCLLQLGGSRLGLLFDEAVQILVRPLTSSAGPRGAGRRRVIADQRRTLHDRGSREKHSAVCRKFCLHRPFHERQRAARLLLSLAGLRCRPTTPKGSCDSPSQLGGTMCGWVSSFVFPGANGD
jgi:Fe2+ transport system protein FeoA